MDPKNNQLYNVEYDFPQQPATGEACTTLDEAERIKAERIKEGFVNVRIEKKQKFAIWSNPINWIRAFKLKEKDEE